MAAKLANFFQFEPYRDSRVILCIKTDLIMKRLLSLLTLVLPVLVFTACDDDHSDLPDVDFIVDISGAVYHDGQIYAVAGETLKITSIRVVNNIHGQNALIPYADYYWDYVRIGQSVVPPYGADIIIAPDMKDAAHLLEIYAPVYAENKSPAYSILQYTVNVVASADDLPADGIASFTARPGIKETDPTR